MTTPRIIVVCLGALVVAAVVLLVLDVVEVEEWIREAPDRLGGATYGFAAGMALLELGSLLGVPLPFEVGIILSGAVAGEGDISLLLLVPIVWACAIVAETVNYLTGRRFGRPFLLQHGARLRVGPERLARLEDHFARHGRATVFFGHVIPFVRSSAPFVAGASLMPYGTFLPWSVLGNLMFAGVFAGLGFGFYRSADRVADLSTEVGLILFALLVLVAAGLLLLRRRRSAAAPDAA